MFLSMTWYEWVATAGIAVALLFILATTVALYRAPDALTRANLLGPTIGIAIPVLLVSLFIVDTARDGFSPGALIRVLLSCFGAWIIASVGSFYMGRSLYGVAVTDVKHARRQQRLAASEKGAKGAKGTAGAAAPEGSE